MARNFIQPGETIDIVATAAVTSGTPIAVGSLAGIPLSSGAIGATVAVRVAGVFEVPKNNTVAFTVGQRVNFRPGTGQFTTQAPAAGDLIGAGVVVAAALTAATTALVRLSPGVATIQP